MEYNNDRTMAQMDYSVTVDGQVMTQQEYDAIQIQRLKDLHMTFSKQRDDWVQKRAQSGVEARWKRAQALYLGEELGEGDGSMMDTLQNGPRPSRSKASEQPRSKVVINIVRPKVDQAVARMCEILLPVDDRNWGIGPTPVPENVKQMAGDQTPLVDPATGARTMITPDMQFQRIVKDSKDRAGRMEHEIDDVLNRCQYNAEQRKMIEDGVRLGTGYLLGPYPANNVKRKWVPSVTGEMQLKIEADVVPATMRADPWDIFTDPACGNDHQRGSGFYHRRFVTRKEIRALDGIPGYDSNAIQQVLLSKPKRTAYASGRVTRTITEDDSYEMWVYYGAVEPTDMELLSAPMGEPLKDVENCVLVMIDDIVIGAMKSWIEDGSLPLDAWNWRKADDSPNGYGLPDEMVHQQRVVNAAWRQVMDDARSSIGGQIVIKKKMVVPQDGNYTIYNNKIWMASDELEDVTKAMHSFEFKNHAPELLQIAAAAMQFADQETSMPQIMGGEKGTAPETVGGMVMLYNNSNTVLRLRVKLYDDCVTVPHIRRYYDWMMANSKKAEIKGDMDVDARGSTALLEKDIQNQATLNLANVTSNPRYQGLIDPKAELKVILKAFKVNPEDVMFSEEKMAENAEKAAQNPPQDPRIATAMIGLEAKKMDIADRQEQRAVDAHLQGAELEVKRETIAYNTERERGESQQARTDAQITRELAIAKMIQDGNLTTEEMASKERLQAIQLDQKAQLFNAEAALRVNTGEGI